MGLLTHANHPAAFQNDEFEPLVSSIVQSVIVTITVSSKLSQRL